jgi:L-malate glycosyltransferase
MILTVVGGYVSDTEKYSNAFVHSRVKDYIRNGIDAKVFLLTTRQKPTQYTFEGVDVTVGRVEDLVAFVESSIVEALCFHFFRSDMIDALRRIEKKLPVFIFVHGHEALMWHERIFPDKLNSFIPFLKFIKYMFVNSYNIMKIRRFLKNTRHRVTIICVSEWMKKVTVRNWRLSNRKGEVVIIPNIINEKTFKFHEKDAQQRYSILMIRSFANGKYAVDKAINVIEMLAELEVFPQINIKIVGRGRLFKKYTSRINHYSNVEIHEGFLTQDEIANVHKEYGIFLCPTRQDAQGVSMCEAMSSGLIPITSLNTAIPEFVPDEYGLACKTEEQMVHKILEIIDDPELFKEISSEVSKFINAKCSREKTTEAEIQLMKNTAKLL